MAIDLVTKFAPYTDEQFKNESKKSLLTNNDFDWTGAHTIKVYKISTSAMMVSGAGLARSLIWTPQPRKWR